MDPVRRCPACGVTLHLVHVHGHGQCDICGSNVEPCCTGSGMEADELGGGDLPAAPDLFQRLFDELGGRDATVTEASLQFALCERLGVTVEEAQIWCESAQRVGVLRAAGAGLWRLAG